MELQPIIPQALTSSSPLPAGTARFQELSYQSRETLDVSYTDGDGRSFHLSIQRDTSVYQATYDRTGALPQRGNAYGQRSKGLRQGLKELAGSLRDAGATADGFRRILHQMLKATDKGYARAFVPQEASGGPVPSVDHAQVLAASQTVTVQMDTVDPDYWSVENTAERLRDFAVSLYEGGDKEAHLGKMLAGLQQGYREAAQAFGGTLPDIARQTVDLARRMLIEWAGQDADAQAGPQDAGGLSLVA